MGAENRRNARVLVQPALNEAVALTNGVGRVLGIRAALIDDGCRDQCAHAAAVDDLGNRVRVVVHVDERRRPAANHLPARELGPDAHEFCVDELDLGREDVVVEPVHERQVVGDAAQQRHRGMRVAVDEPRHDDPIGAWQGGARGVGLADITCRTDLKDHAVIDCDRAVFDHSHVAIHRDDVIAFDDQVDGLLRLAGCQADSEEKRCETGGYSCHSGSSSGNCSIGSTNATREKKSRSLTGSFVFPIWPDQKSLTMLMPNSLASLLMICRT